MFQWALRDVSFEFSFNFCSVQMCLLVNRLAGTLGFGPASIAETVPECLSGCLSGALGRTPSDCHTSTLPWPENDVDVFAANPRWLSFPKRAAQVSLCSRKINRPCGLRGRSSFSLRFICKVGHGQSPQLVLFPLVALCESQFAWNAKLHWDKSTSKTDLRFRGVEKWSAR